MSNIDKFIGKIVYHISDSDLDGIGCRVLGEYFIKPVAKEYIPYNTADRQLPDLDFTAIQKSDIVLFTDITPYSMELYQTITEEYKKECYIFDHHVSAKNSLNIDENYFYDVNRSASQILFDHLVEGTRVKKSLYQFIELVNTYDLYMVNSNLWRSAKALNNILWGYVNWFVKEPDTIKHSKFIEMQIKKISKNNIYFYTASEKEMAYKAEKKEKENFNEAKRNIRIRTDNEGNKYAYTECTSKVSWVANLLLKEYDYLQYIAIRATFVDKKEGVSLKISLRSRDFDTTRMSQKFGGGGHVMSSSFYFKDIQELTDFKQGKFHLI